MASIKIFSLAVRTLAKPIATTIKSQAGDHESFRRVCIGLAQSMHRTEARMRMGLLNEEAKNIKPLNDAKAVQNGASMMAEGFLFLKNEKRRDLVAERLDHLEEAVEKLNSEESEDVQELQERSAALERALQTVVANGLRAGWLNLGHPESEVGRLLGELPGQPFALRNRDGSDSETDLPDLLPAVTTSPSPIDPATQVADVSGSSETDTESPSYSASPAGAETTPTTPS